MTKKLALCFGLACTLACMLEATPVYSTSSTTQVACLGQNMIVAEVNGTSCPAGSIGPYIDGGSNGSDVGGLIAFGHIGTGTPPVSGTESYSFGAGSTESVTETNGTGPGIEQFTITFTWFAVGDPGSPEVDASLLYNGAVAWSAQRIANGRRDGSVHVETAVVDEAFVYGQPFEVQANLTALGQGTDLYGSDGVWLQGEMQISRVDPPIEAPEPGTGWMMMGVMGVAGVIGLLGKSRSRSR